MANAQTKDPALEAIREMSDSVAASFNVLEEGIEGVKGDVGKLGERVDHVEKDLGQRRARREPSTRDRSAPPELYLRGENGERIRLLRPGERIADVVGGSDASPGEVVRGLATGKWTPEAQKAALGSGTTSGGGVLLAPQVSAAIVDLARARSAVVRAGALTVPMPTGEVKIARVTADPAVAWRAENVPIVASDPTFAGVTLRARTLAVLTKMPIELVEDAANLEAFIETVFAGALAAEIDRVALVGSGAAEEPLGLENTPGVGTITGVSTFAYDDVVDAVVKVREANGEPNAAIFAPRDVGTLEKSKWTNGDYLSQPESYRALARFATTNVPKNRGGGANESLAFVGDFSALWLGVRTELTLEASREAADSSGSAFASLQLWLRGYIRLDVACVQPAFFTVLSGITT